MVTPAVQLACKTPDVHTQLWESAILKGKLFCNQLYKANWRLHKNVFFSEFRFVSDVRRWRPRSRSLPDARQLSQLLMKNN